MRKFFTTNQVYRSVFLDYVETSDGKKEKYGDLIAFYNEVYIKKVKLYIVQMNSSFKPTTATTASQITPVSSQFICPSPVPKLPSVALALNIQFSPCKLIDNHFLFVSPSKANFTSNSIQLIAPMQLRKKLTFSINDTNQIKVNNFFIW